MRWVARRDAHQGRRVHRLPLNSRHDKGLEDVVGVFVQKGTQDDALSKSTGTDIVWQWQIARIEDLLARIRKFIDGNGRRCTQQKTSGEQARQAACADAPHGS